MAKKEKEQEKKPVVVLDEKEYEVESMADDQKVMLAHIQDLQRKIDSATFNLQQLQYGRQAFVNALKQALEAEDVEE